MNRLLTVLEHLFHTKLEKLIFLFLGLFVVIYFVACPRTEPSAAYAAIYEVESEIEIEDICIDEDDEVETEPMPTFVSKKETSRTEFINRFKKTAINEHKRYGIPASITLAQGILESRSGNSKLAKTANNYFGIKCFDRICRKGHCVHHPDKDNFKSFFKKYDSAWSSFRAHRKFLLKKRYEPLFDCKDYKCWAKGLEDKGYATDTLYAEKLITVIESEGLHKYDK